MRVHSVRNFLHFEADLLMSQICIMYKSADTTTKERNRGLQIRLDYEKKKHRYLIKKRMTSRDLTINRSSDTWRRRSILKEREFWQNLLIDLNEIIIYLKEYWTEMDRELQYNCMTRNENNLEDCMQQLNIIGEYVEELLAYAKSKLRKLSMDITMSTFLDNFENNNRIADYIKKKIKFLSSYTRTSFFNIKRHLRGDCTCC